MQPDALGQLHGVLLHVAAADGQHRRRRVAAEPDQHALDGHRIALLVEDQRLVVADVEPSALDIAVAHHAVERGLHLRVVRREIHARPGRTEAADVL